jgi:hypothetical protein
MLTWLPGSGMALLQDDLARGSPKRDAGVKVGQVGGIGLAGKGSAIDAGDQSRALRHTIPPADTASLALNPFKVSAVRVPTSSK